MKNIYYLIWSDAILSFKKYNPNKDWKVRLFVFITMMNALNLWIIILWLKYFEVFEIPPLVFEILPGEMLNDFLAFTVEFALPFIIINYILIFHKNRYKKIIEKYRDRKTRYALFYSLSMTIGAFISAIIYGILQGDIF